ncbi:hypothetical protein [Candidatus Poriferisodalis sp.]|uniref:hypothetical protein n=1 Tax=Candidatus Poriferisodalis sp. TaxID=3101277 RepID=UPI003C6FA496
MTAISVTAVSVALAYRPEAADTDSTVGLPSGWLMIVAVVCVGAVALVNGLFWIKSHTAARHWREVADFDVLTSFPGTVNALPRLQRHLVSTFLRHFNHNERIVRRVQRMVGAQAVFTLAVIYLVAVVWASVLR